MKTLAFKQGKLAAKTGKRVTTNPYKTRSAFGREEGAKNYNDWLDGYLEQKGFKL